MNSDKNEWVLLDAEFNKISILPSSASHFKFILNEPGSGSMSIPMTSRAAALVTSGMFAVASYRGSPRGGFSVDNIAKDFAVEGNQDGGLWMDISGSGEMILLEEAVVVPGGDGTVSTRKFTGTKAGILIALIEEAKNRTGCIQNVAYDFSALLDSDGNAWEDDDPTDITVGINLLEVVRQFAELGIEFSMSLEDDEFVLKAFKNGIGSNKSSAVFMRIGKNCEVVKSDERGGDLKNALLLAYKTGIVEIKDDTSIVSHRRRERYVDAKNAQSSGAVTTYGAAVLENSKLPKKGITVKVYDGVSPNVFLDYGMGDTISVDTNGVIESHRVLGIQCDWDGVSYSNVTLELNSLLLENELKMAKDISRLASQWATAHDADLLETTRWVGLGGDTEITRINAIEVEGDKVYVAGLFTEIGGVSAKNIAVYDITTGTWGALGGGAGSEVYCMAVNGTDVYIGGAFATVGDGVLAAGIATYDGSAWSELGNGISYLIGNTFNIARVYSMMYDDGYVYIAGFFNVVNFHGDEEIYVQNHARYYVASDVWQNLGDSGGTADHDGVDFSNWLLDDGNLYIGASVNAGITNQFSVRKWNGGTSWSIIGGEFDQRIWCLATAGDVLVAGGDFTGHISGFTGGAWGTFAGGADGTVYGMASYLSDLYVVGSFTNIGNRISKYSAGNWSTLETGLNATTTAIAMHEDDVYVGGGFSNAGGKSTEKLAAYLTSFESLVEYLENSQSSFNMAAAIHNAPESVITDEDEIPFWENITTKLRKITWANIKTTLTSVFVAMTGDQSVAGIKTFIDSINIGNMPPVSGPDGTMNQVTEGASAGNTLWTFGSTFASFLTGVFANGTKTSPTAALENDVLLKLRGRAHDGTTYGNTCAMVTWVANEDHDASSHGSRIEIWTTPDGSTTLTKALTVDNDGNINIEAGNTYNIDGIPIGGGGIVESVVAGTNVSVDNTDPANPVVSAVGGGSDVQSVQRSWFLC